MCAFCFVCFIHLFIICNIQPNPVNEKACSTTKGGLYTEFYMNHLLISQPTEFEICISIYSTALHIFILFLEELGTGLTLLSIIIL